MHTLTYFGVHTPARAFADDVAAQRDVAVERALDAIDEVLDEPIESLLATDRDGAPCLEAKAPQDVDEALAMPGGHIFHGDLAWPWAPEPGPAGLPRPALGRGAPTCRTCCCAGRARAAGGAVSGLGGHNAAQAVLDVATRDR